MWGRERGGVYLLDDGDEPGVDSVQGANGHHADAGLAHVDKPPDGGHAGRLEECLKSGDQGLVADRRGDSALRGHENRSVEPRALGDPGKA